MDLSKIDLDRLKADVAGALADGISDLVEGAKQDVQDYAGMIARDMLEAQLTGNTAITDQLLGQLKLLAEINRVRVENHAWVVVANVTKAVLKAAVAGAVSVFL